MSDEKLAVGLDEAAQMLSTCRRTIENFIASGHLKSVKLGRRRVVRVSDLQRFLSADRPSPRSART